MRVEVSTKGPNDIVDISATVQKAVANSQISDGAVLINVIGSTAAISTMEFEPNLVRDQQAVFESLVSSRVNYAHNATWGDGNGHSHLRATLYKPSLVLPVEKGAVVLGTWQQIVLLEFDVRPRTREVVIKVISER